ncbi:MAG: hypothetical protein P4L53_05275 [Candidatus Obscuribacterales bacterium]|nr:hypothetical protein [Candidatus Obscuribacterales bacterium]
MYYDIRDTFGDTSSRKSRETALQRAEAQAAYDRVCKTGNPFVESFKSRRSVSLLFGYAVIIALSLFYFCPLLPGVAFDGTIYGAAATAAVIVAIAHISGSVFALEMRLTLKRMANGQRFVWLFASAWLGLLLMPLIEVAVVSIYPGYLNMDGFWAFVFASTTMIAVSFVYFKSAEYIWPAPPVPQIVTEAE